jgi:hypothetical protein
MGAGILFMVGCSDNDQDKEVERQKRIAAQEQQEQDQRAREQASATQDTSSSDSQPAQEETKPEPKTETITTYHFTSSTERGAIDCKDEGKVSACGVSYESCGDGSDSYACQVGVHEWHTQKDVLVTE